MFTMFCINTTYICDKNNSLDLTIRNNINGDFIKVKKLSDILPGAFITINWKDKKLMLPYSLRNGFISFSDLNWDWRYEFRDNGEINEIEPTLYEIKSMNQYIEHKCDVVGTEVS